MEYNNDSVHPSEDSSYHYRAEQLESWSDWEQPKQPSKRKSKGWTAGRVIALALVVSILT